MSGEWKRSMAELVRHRQTKEPEIDRLRLNHRATPRLYSDEEGIRIAALTKTAAILESTAEICICRAKHYLDAVVFVLELPVGRSSKSTRTIPA